MVEVVQQENIQVRYVSTDKQCADICTKAFNNKEKWEALLKLVRIIDPSIRSRFLSAPACFVGRFVPQVDCQD